MVKAISIIVVELSKLWSGFFKVILIYLLKFFFFSFFSRTGPRMVCSLVFLEVVVTPNCNNIIREKIKFKIKKDSC